jgi:hypothetical protein
VVARRYTPNFAQPVHVVLELLTKWKGLLEVSWLHRSRKVI